MATSEVAYGSVGVTDVFLATSTHTAVQKKDNSGAATALTDRVIRLGDQSGDNLSVASEIQPDGAKLTVPVTHTNMSEDFTTFRKMFTPWVQSTATSGRKKLEGESGRSIGSDVASSTTQGLIINYGPVKSDKVLVTIALGGFSPTLGKRKNENNWIQPESQFISGPCQKDPSLTIKKELFDPAIVDVSADQTILVNEYGVELWLDAAS